MSSLALKRCVGGIEGVGYMQEGCVVSCNFGIFVGSSTNRFLHPPCEDHIFSRGLLASRRFFVS